MNATKEKEQIQADVEVCKDNMAHVIKFSHVPAIYKEDQDAF